MGSYRTLGVFVKAQYASSPKLDSISWVLDVFAPAHRSQSDVQTFSLIKGSFQE